MNLTWQDILSIVGGVGGLCGGYSLYQNWEQTKLAREQTKLMKDQSAKQEAAEKADHEWAERHDKLGHQLQRLGPSLMVADPSANSHLVLYGAVFPEQQLRDRIETYIVKRGPGGSTFIPLHPTPHELRGTLLRKTVEQAEQAITEFADKNPKIKIHYYLNG